MNFPVSLGRGLGLFRHLVGSSSAVMSLVNILMASFTAFMMSFITADSAIPLACIYLGLMLVGGLVFFVLIRHQSYNQF